MRIAPKTLHSYTATQLQDFPINTMKRCKGAHRRSRGRFRGRWARTPGRGRARQRCRAPAAARSGRAAGCRGSARQGSWGWPPPRTRSSSSQRCPRRPSPPRLRRRRRRAPRGVRRPARTLAASCAGGPHGPWRGSASTCAASPPCVAAGGS